MGCKCKSGMGVLLFAFGHPKKQDRNEQSGKKQTQRIALLGIILLGVFMLSFSIGRYGVSVSEVVRIFLGRIFPMTQTWTAEMQTVVLNIRLPRIVMACLVGCALSAAGASYQGVFQNPMASPDILGASSGQRLGRHWQFYLAGLRESSHWRHLPPAWLQSWLSI